MPEFVNKVVDFATTQPSAAVAVIAAIALLLLVATPIASLALAGYVIRAWVRQGAKGGNQ